MRLRLSSSPESFDSPAQDGRPIWATDRNSEDDVLPCSQPGGDVKNRGIKM